MSDLVEFLLARIAEDEARLSDVWKRPHWGLLCNTQGDLSSPTDKCDCGLPARVLAECEAKRRIVETYLRTRERIDANVAEHTRASNRGDLAALPTIRSGGWDLGGRDWALEMTLRLLALPYADHPEWREEWRP